MNTDAPTMSSMGTLQALSPLNVTVMFTSFHSILDFSDGISELMVYRLSPVD
jgi:hypothetical protein